MRRYGLAALLIGAAVLSLSCNLMRGSGVQSFVEEPFPARLSEWRLFVTGGGPLKPNRRVVPYDLNTPLFSDYAGKHRFVWMPEGKSAVYQDDKPFEFPVGTILSKSFSFPVGGGSGREKLIETRLLVRAKTGWVSLPYIWNADQTEATLAVAGGSEDVTFVNAAGKRETIHYQIPNTNECAQCHEVSKKLLPIGPQARNLNRDFQYDDGPENQLVHWARIGYLTGAPAPDKAPRMAVWDDPGSGSVEARARAYLDGNCAHCHQTGGSAGYTGFLLTWKEKDPRRLGYCKNPNSAGYSGNLAFDLVPGNPDESIIIYRMKSTRAKEMMPEIGRSMTHDEGIELVREWIGSLKGKCN